MGLAEGEFTVSCGDDNVEVWITQMGPWANMNTAFIDRKNGVVAIVDPFDGEGWLKALAEENLTPSHILLTHTHRDHTAGVSSIRKVHPEIEVWGHVESVSPVCLVGSFSEELTLPMCGNRNPMVSSNGNVVQFTSLSSIPRDIPRVTLHCMDMECMLLVTCCSQCVQAGLICRAQTLRLLSLIHI